MQKFFNTLLIGTALALSPIGLGHVQKKKSECERVTPAERNWIQMEHDYVYFDSVLCPADVTPAKPPVSIWITTLGDGISVEKWAPDRDGADLVSVFHGKKKAYTIYRDLNAVPLSIFKAERRSGVAADMSKQPFFVEGTTLAPLENLTPDSAERVKKVFDNADGLIRKAELKVALLRESQRIEAIVIALEKPIKLQP
jgi:hypothetical protein